MAATGPEIQPRVEQGESKQSLPGLTRRALTLTAEDSPHINPDLKNFGVYQVDAPGPDETTYGIFRTPALGQVKLTSTKDGDGPLGKRQSAVVKSYGWNPDTYSDLTLDDSKVWSFGSEDLSHIDFILSTIEKDLSNRPTKKSDDGEA